MNYIIDSPLFSFLRVWECIVFTAKPKFFCCNGMILLVLCVYLKRYINSDGEIFRNILSNINIFYVNGY